jgi:sugar phosphate isomerase/epimerase
MNARSSADIGIDQVYYAKKIGLEYLELSVDRVMRYDDNRFESFKKEITESPLPCLVCNNFVDPSVKLVGRDYNRNVFENYITKALERIALIGAKKVVFGSSKARLIPSYLSAEEGRGQVIERIKFIAGAAEKRGIQVEIEHLNRIECNVINTFEESTAIAKQLNRPNLKSIFDSYHFQVSGEDEKLIRQNEAWIGHMHFACTLERHMPNMDEVKKMKPLLEILRDCSYNETFSLEAYFPNLEMDNPYFAEPVAYITGLLNGKKEN